MSKENICNGCQDEINEAYYWQKKGFNIDFEYYHGHFCLIVFNNRGEVILR